MNEWDYKSSKESDKKCLRTLRFRNVLKHFTFFRSRLVKAKCESDEKNFSAAEWSTIPFYESAKNAKQKQQTSRVENFSLESSPK